MDVPFETFPASAWLHLGQTADRRWRLRLREGFLPQHLSDLRHVELQLTATQLAEWEVRWLAQSEQEIADLDRIHKMRRQRTEQDVAIARARNSLTDTTTEGWPSIDDIREAIVALHNAGTESQRTGAPTQKQVGARLGHSASTIKRACRAAGLKWRALVAELIPELTRKGPPN